MSFLQPWMLWGLALMAVPIVIHLLNRMRYRSQAWAAMSFLLSANKQSRRHAKLRHWLILMFRALAIAALVLALARPIAGGWLGWAMHGAPETVIVLLDRSASMEGRNANNSRSKRETVLQRFREAAESSSSATRFVLLDSATLQPQEVTGLGDLASLAVAGPTDTAADIPAMLAAAVDYILANQTGHTEFWIASDLQRSNWSPDSPRWAEVIEQIRALPQEVRTRLLAVSYDVPENVAVRIEQARRQTTGENSMLHLTIDLRREQTVADSFPLSIVLEGARRPLDVRIDNQQLRLHHQIGLSRHPGSGWGWVELPNDANPRDNRSYYVFNPELHLSALIVSEDAATSRLLQLATAPAPTIMRNSANVISAGAFNAADVAQTALIVWQAAAPSGDAEAKLQRFIESGGVVVMFPSGAEPTSDVTKTGMVSSVWGKIETAEAEKPFRVTTWENRDGLLAKTADGVDLPLTELSFTRRQSINGEWSSVASFSDGTPFLVRRQIGQGTLYVCAALPLPDWSTLGESLVLVPMLQRAFQDGGERLGSAVNTVCGDPLVSSRRDWKRIDAENGAPWLAGVYQNGNRLVALNRPPSEDEQDIIEPSVVRTLFGPVSLRFFEESTNPTTKLHSEVWRMFLWAVLFFMLAEGLLAMPGKAPAIIIPETHVRPAARPVDHVPKSKPVPAEVAR